jgi:hypothetical protein
MRLRRAMALTAVSLCALAGCGGPSIVGKWQRSMSDEELQMTATIDFRANGEVHQVERSILKGETLDTVSDGHWEVSGSGESMVLTVTFDKMVANGRELPIALLKAKGMSEDMWRQSGSISLGKDTFTWKPVLGRSKMFPKGMVQDPRTFTRVK